MFKISRPFSILSSWYILLVILYKCWYKKKFHTRKIITPYSTNTMQNKLIVLFARKKMVIIILSKLHISGDYKMLHKIAQKPQIVL